MGAERPPPLPGEGTGPVTSARGVATRVTTQGRRGETRHSHAEAARGRVRKHLVPSSQALLRSDPERQGWEGKLWAQAARYTE